MRTSYLYICAFLMLLLSCGDKQTRYEADLERAESLVTYRPDSALSILDSLRQYVGNMDESENMRFWLNYVKAKSKNFIPLSEDSIMRRVVDYYNVRGNNNLRMDAYYQLGCVYRDMNDAPMALECYHKALGCANEEDSDCDYYTLERVHGQIASLFGYRRLFVESNEENDLAIKYAYKACDTLFVIQCMESKIANFYQLGAEDSVLKLTSDIHSTYLNVFKDTVSAALGLNTSVLVYLNRGDYENLGKLISFYENQSKWIDKNGNVSPGREFFYYAKGMYCLGMNNRDSAEYFFRREMNTASDWNNRELAYKGLMKLYDSYNNVDSVAKYAGLHSIATDSAFNENASFRLSQLQSLYNYRHHRDVAEQMTAEAEFANRILLMLVILFIVLVIAAVLAFFLYRSKQNLQKAMAIARLAKSEAELATAKEKIWRAKDEMSAMQRKLDESAEEILEHDEKLRSMIEELNSLNNLHIADRALISAKEQEISEYREEMESIRREREKIKSALVQGGTTSTHIIPKLQSKCYKGELATEEEWSLLSDEMSLAFPNLVKVLFNPELPLSVTERRVSMLIRVGFSPKDIAVLVGRQKQAISNARVRIFEKTHPGEKGSTELADRWILSL